MTLDKVFDNILDIPGVDGVCLFGNTGQIYVNRMPSFFSADLFADALRRITALYETMDENFLPCDDYLLRFAEKWLLFRRTDQSVLLILAAETANFASTRMVTNMALKHLTPTALAEYASGSPAPIATAPPPASARPGQGMTTSPFSASPFSNSPFPAQAPAVPPAPVAAEVPVEAAVDSGVTKVVRMFRGRAY